MKSIENFKKERLDMKGMAALRGGVTTHRSSTMHFPGGVVTTTWEDRYFWNSMSQGWQSTGNKYNIQTEIRHFVDDCPMG